MAIALPVIDLADSQTGCYPRFDPQPWDGQEFRLEGQRLIKAVTCRYRSGFRSAMSMAEPR